MRSSITLAALLALASPLIGCQKPAPPAPSEWTRETLPAALAASTAKAEATMDTLQKRLLAALTEKVAAGGPVEGISACRSIAPVLTASVSAAGGVELGRTSFKLRNPANAPRAWARPHVEAAAGKKASALKTVYVDLGDRVGVLRPIPTGQPCLLCHGDPSGFGPELTAALATAYPEDKATGFALGDLRGFFWAEVKK